MYVDDKAAVRRAIQQAGEQISATELVHGKRSLEETIFTRKTQQHRAFLDRMHQWWRSHFPRREAAVAAMRAVPQKAVGTTLNHTPEFGRS